MSLLDLKKGATFVCQSGRYIILDFIGEGSFGKVAKCWKVRSNETVAIKMHKNHLSNADIHQEVEMLQVLSALDPDKNNLVEFKDSFDCQNCYCLAFEMLDKSLWDLMQDRSWKPLTLSEIRPITQQMLIAFNALKGLGIMHTDVKVDNIMLVNHQDQPFKVKLIDFGLAFAASEAQVGITMQAPAFRAPEVFLGLPISEAIDMWGLGCVLAFLYFGNYLFPNGPPYETMKAICQLLGQPEDHLLNAGTKTSDYFIKRGYFNNPRWRLRTKNEIWFAGNNDDDDYYSVAELNSHLNLDGIVKGLPATTDALEYEDRMEFLHFLKGLLHVDAEQRLTPSQALQHNFITMAHLKGHSNTSYAKNAHKLMAVCTSVNESGETDDCLSKSKQDGVFTEENGTAEEIMKGYMDAYIDYMHELTAWHALLCDSEDNWVAEAGFEDDTELSPLHHGEVSDRVEMEGDSLFAAFDVGNPTAQEIDYLQVYTCYMDEAAAWTDLNSYSIPVVFSEDSWAAQEILQDFKPHCKHEALACTERESDLIPDVFAQDNWAAQKHLQDRKPLFV